MKQLINGLATQKYTKVMMEKEFKYNAPHNFKVIQSIPKNEPYFGNTEYVEPKVLAEIHFQEGPIKECGVNGVCGEDLVNMVIERLKCFQNSEFACKENEMALTKFEEGLMWLRRRTTDREIRGVEGTHIK